VVRAGLDRAESWPSDRQEASRHRGSWKTDDFRWPGKHSFRRGDKLMMITHEGSGRRLVDPPGTVLYVRNYRLNDGKAAFVYLEFRNKRRRDMQSVARHLGRGAMKRLRRGGPLSKDFAAKLFDYWQG
jgi:hypothetical protein